MGFEGDGAPSYSNPDGNHVGGLAEALRSRGIECEVRRSRPSPLMDRPSPELWVLDQSQLGQARQIVRAARDEIRQQLDEAPPAPTGDREANFE